MLSCNLTAEDLAKDWHADETGWYCGQSYVKPYSHRIIETLAFRTKGRMAFVVREHLRRGVSALEVSPLRDVSDDEFDSAVHEAKRWPLNHVTLIIDRCAAAVSIYSGEWAVAPLYVLGRPGILYADWDVANLYTHVRSSIDFGRASHYLVGLGCPYSRVTLFPEISQLTERSEAFWNGLAGDLRIDYPPRVARPAAKELRADADVLGMFESILAASMRRWLTDDRPMATQLSGGLDSSVVALVGAKESRHGLRSYGLVMPGENGRWQSIRRDEVAALAGANDHHIPAEDHLPFLSGSQRVQGTSHVPWGEYYDEALGALLDQARADGMDVMFTGAGGDEISAVTWRELQMHGISKPDDDPPETDGDGFPPFLTPAGLDAYHATAKCLDEAPRPATELSALEAAASGTTCFLRRGVWPVNPYFTPELVWFCRSLPFEWRYGRALQRRYLLQRGCSQEVAFPQVKESFCDVMEQSLKHRSRNLLQSIFSDSRLAAMGLVERSDLLRTYEDYCADRDGQWGDSILGTAVLELTVRALERSRSAA